MHSENGARLAALCDRYKVEHAGDLAHRAVAVAAKVGAKVNPHMQSLGTMLDRIDDAAEANRRPRSTEANTAGGAGAAAAPGKDGAK